MFTVWQDFRFALRSLRQSPGAALTAIAALAIGIGVNTTIFTMYDALALKRLPVANSRDLVRLERWFAGGGRGDVQFLFSKREYLHLRDHGHAFRSIAAATDAVPAVCYVRGKNAEQGTAPDQAEQFVASTVSDNFFSTLGTSTAIGRVFSASDKYAAAEVVLSYPFWQRRFQAESTILGTGISVGGIEATIIGVTAPGFIGAGAPPSIPDLWLSTPARSAYTPLDDSNAQFMVLARLGSAVSPKQAEAETMLLIQQQAQLVPPRDKTVAISARPATYFASTDDLGFTATVAFVMFAGALLLFVACANLINLLLARATSRRRELGTRAGLGASRTRLISQLLTESIVLAFFGALAGLALSVWGVRYVWLTAQSWIEQFLGSHAFVLNLDPDVHIFAYATVLAVTTGALFGILPAIRASKVDLVSSLKAEGAAAGAGQSLTRLGPRGLFLASQVAVTVLLLVTAGLLLRSLASARNTNPGFPANRLITLFVDTNHSNALSVLLSRLPQVTVVARADRSPFLGHGMTTFSLAGSAQQSLPDKLYFTLISPTYFDALGLDVLWGRPFSVTEPTESAIISDVTARRLWPGANPIGQRITFTAYWIPERLRNRTFTIVGVVQSARTVSLSQIDPSHIYLPLSPSDQAALLVRTREDSANAIPAIRASLWQYDKSLATTTSIVPLKDAIAFERALMSEIPLTLAAGLGILSLILAAAGIFGLTSYIVASRTREIGVRVALGATRNDVFAAVLKNAFASIFWGAGAGLLLSSMLALALRAWMTVPDSPDLLFGVSPLDVRAFSTVLLFIAAVALCAAYLPARRATRVDPLVALRYE